MPKAILHIGTMKTGTTSIQKALSSNTDVLSRHGYNYLGPPMRHSTILAPAIAALPHKDRDLIISDEGLWHFADSKRSDTAKLAKILEHYDVNVLIYLRRPDSFLNSWFQQGLKSGTGSLTMSQFLASAFVQSGLRFQHLIAQFEAVFGKDSIILRPYEKSQLAQEDAVLDFLETLGLPVNEFILPSRSNATPDTDNLLLRSLFQRDLPRSSRLTNQLDKLMLHLNRYGYQGRRYSLLSPDELREIIATYRPVFTELQTRYGGGIEPDFFQSWPEPTQAVPGLLGLRWTQEAILKSSDT